MSHGAHVTDEDSSAKAKRYRMQAEEVRGAAESVHLLGASQSMLDIAHAYDLLADELEASDLPLHAHDALIG